MIRGPLVISSCLRSKGSTVEDRRPPVRKRERYQAVLRPSRTSRSLLPVHTVPTSYLPPPNKMSGILTEKAEDGERGRSRFGQLHVEAFQDTSDVVSLRQEKLSFLTIPTNLHSKYVSCRTESFMANFNRSFRMSSVSSPVCQPESSMSFT